MLAAEHYTYYDGAMPNRQLFEIYRSNILAHHAKAGYDYPTIRLPFTVSGRIGLPTRIYQTVHDGALAFLVVVSPSNKAAEESAKKSENAAKSAKSPALTWRRSPVRIRPSPLLFFLSVARIWLTMNLTQTRNCTISCTTSTKKRQHTTETMMSSLRAFWRCLCATTNNAQARDVRNVPVGG